MRKFALPIALITSLALAGSALAATSNTTNTIKAIDTKALTITLQDGTVYFLPANFKLAGFKVGEKVTITWDMLGTKHEATAMIAAV